MDCYRFRLPAGRCLCVSVSGCVCADFIWYEAGRHWGEQDSPCALQPQLEPPKVREQGSQRLLPLGELLLLFAKFVPGLDGFTLPLAGMEGCGMPAFVLLDAIGSLCWSGAYVVVGYLYREAGTLR
jgi:membrane protein DedA with SNARE-associated domain